MTIRAIETSYKGYRFRSRLEARWAVFFDAVNLRWEYEAEGYDVDGNWYLPDFVVSIGRCAVYIEIKPKTIGTEEFMRLHRFVLRNQGSLILLEGSPGGTTYEDPASYRATLIVGALTDLQNLAPHALLDIIEGVAVFEEKLVKLRDSGVDIKGFGDWGYAFNYIPRWDYLLGTARYLETVYRKNFPTDNRSIGGHGEPATIDVIDELVFSVGIGNRVYLTSNFSDDDAQDPMLLGAYQAARAARFEFGENGNSPSVATHLPQQ